MNSVTLRLPWAAARGSARRRAASGSARAGSRPRPDRTAATRGSSWRMPGDVAAEHRQPRGHRLERDPRQPLAPRRQHQDVGRRHGRHDPLRPGEMAGELDPVAERRGRCTSRSIAPRVSPSPTSLRLRGRPASRASRIASTSSAWFLTGRNEPTWISCRRSSRQGAVRGGRSQPRSSRMLEIAAVVAPAAAG